MDEFFRRAAVMLLLSALLNVPVAAQSEKAPAAVKDVESAAGFAAIGPRMQAFVDDDRMAGAVTLVADDHGVLDVTAVGQADREAGREMTPETLFAIASMTKPVAATATMILVDEGKLDLDAPVSKYLPEFADVRLHDGSKPQRVPTLRDLMTHTSGLGGEQRLSGSLEETVKEIAGRPLAFEPGTKWQYSPGMTVAGRVVEVVSGTAFDEFIATRIFRPLGMKETTFTPSDAQLARIAQLYKNGSDGKGLETSTSWIHDSAEGRDRGPNPSAGLFSTAGDMARFYRMVLNGGELDGTRILSEDAVREMTRVQTGDIVTGFTPGNGWGLGWCVVREPQGVTEMLSPGTFGHGGAFGTQGWVDPERKTVFVMMIQRTGLPNADGSDMRAAFQQTAVDARK